MDIAKEKLKLQKMQMQSNIVEAGIRVEERKNDIKRIEESIETYEIRIKEIEVQLKGEK